MITGGSVAVLAGKVYVWGGAGPATPKLSTVSGRCLKANNKLHYTPQWHTLVVAS
jgi:hypothetical protein